MARVPRFDGLKPTSPTASRVKQQVRAKDTKPEIALRSALHRRGLRFRVHRSDLPGKPDVVFPSARVVIFVDGDYWHGRNWPARRRRLAKGANSEYWLAKIKTNMARDRKQTKLLERAGWCVLRLWETDVLRDPDHAADLVETLVRARANARSDLQRKPT